MHANERNEALLRLIGRYDRWNTESREAIAAAREAHVVTGVTVVDDVDRLISERERLQLALDELWNTDTDDVWHDRLDAAERADQAVEAALASLRARLEGVATTPSS